MKTRKILAILLALAMAFSMFSVTAFAEGNGNVAEVGGVGYATLEDAIAAADAGDTVTLLADIDYSEVTKNRNAHDRGEELKIDLKDLTLDLNGNTISTVNASVVFTGNGATIENGSFALVHIKSNGDHQAGSYGLCLDAYGQETDITLNNLDVEGGINVWGAKVTINDVNAETTASKFYAVWAEDEGAVVTINSGIFTDAQSGGKGILATGTGAEGGAKLYINGGTFNATNNLVSSAEANSIKIAGGTYDKDPTAYVADGYEAVSNGTWTVGKIVAKAISESAATTEGYDATYTATKQVVDDDNNVLSTGNSVKVDVVAVTEDTVASDTTIAKIDVSAILDDIVAAAGEADEVSVKIKIVSDTPEVVENTITYEVHPEAETYVNDSLVANVKIGNSALKDNASFTITLAVPDELVANGFVQVTHKSKDFGDETKVCAVEGVAGGYYVVLEVTHFSEFELKKIDNIIDSDDMATWGASLLLEDDVKINVYVENLKDMSGNTEANPGRYKLVYTFNGVTNEAYLTSAASNSVIVARCAAKQLADVVTLELYYDDILIKSNTYSAKKYCDDAIDGNWDEKDVCAALLEFGGYAQIRFNYNTDNMANADHSLGEAPDTTVPDSYSYSIDGYSGAVVAAFGASLSLESKTELNIYFTPYANSLDGYTAYVNDNEIGIVQVNPDGDVAGIITVPGIVAKDLAEEIAIEISNGSASFTLNYSPIAHAERCQDDVTEGNLFKAMYLYHLAAKTYFENKNS